jgi:hypothetical protein
MSVCVSPPVVARQRLRKHGLKAKNTHATIAELCGVCRILCRFNICARKVGEYISFVPLVASVVFHYVIVKMVSFFF